MHGTAVSSNFHSSTISWNIVVTPKIQFCCIQKEFIQIEFVLKKFYSNEFELKKEKRKTFFLLSIPSPAHISPSPLFFSPRPSRPIPPAQSTSPLLLSLSLTGGPHLSAPSPSSSAPPHLVPSAGGRSAPCAGSPPSPPSLHAIKAQWRAAAPPPFHFRFLPFPLQRPHHRAP